MSEVVEVTLTWEPRVSVSVGGEEPWTLPSASLLAPLSARVVLTEDVVRGDEEALRNASLHEGQGAANDWLAWLTSTAGQPDADYRLQIVRAVVTAMRVARARMGTRA